MKIRLIVPIIYQNRVCQKGAVLNVSAVDGASMVHDKIAIPEPEPPQRQIIKPAELRRSKRYG